MTPRVTFLVPVYNGASHLAVSIESVLAQTFEDFELLLIDDVSSDDSVEIARSYRDPRVRILQNDANLGQVATLNRGLREATAPLIARLDQDDRCTPTRLERQVAVLDAVPRVAIVASWMDLVDDSGRIIGELRGRLDSFPTFVASALFDRLPLAHPTVTFRRDVILSLGGYDEGVPLAEDHDLWRRCAMARHEARVVREPLVLYRVHAGQQSSLRAQEQLDANAAALDRFYEELSPTAGTTPLRLLLTWSPRFWHDRGSRVDLERFLRDAAARLDLTPTEDAELRRLVGARAAGAARRAWRTGPAAQWRETPALFVRSLAIASPLRRLVEPPLYLGALVLSPALARAGAMLAALAPAAPIARAKSLARRSRVLRALSRTLRNGRSLGAKQP